MHDENAIALLHANRAVALNLERSWRMAALACHPTCPPSPLELQQLTEPRRAVRVCSNGASARCDRTAVLGMGRTAATSQWFMLAGAAGTRLPTEPPGGRRCGTDWAGWLVSPHPAAGQPLANGTVCFASTQSECATSVDVH
eukprot:6769447-Prymnesium_polylepis.1